VGGGGGGGWGVGETLELRTMSSLADQKGNRVVVKLDYTISRKKKKLFSGLPFGKKKLLLQAPILDRFVGDTVRKRIRKTGEDPEQVSERLATASEVHQGSKR